MVMDIITKLNTLIEQAKTLSEDMVGFVEKRRMLVAIEKARHEHRSGNTAQGINILVDYLMSQGIHPVIHSVEVPEEPAPDILTEGVGYVAKEIIPFKPKAKKVNIPKVKERNFVDAEYNRAYGTVEHNGRSVAKFVFARDIKARDSRHVVKVAAKKLQGKKHIRRNLDLVLCDDKTVINPA